MPGIVDILPFLIAMLVLIGVSAFFSASEAALFSLTASDRKSLRQSTHPAARSAAVLLRSPERLLSAILFWNLVTNITYFALTSLAATKLSKNPEATNAQLVGLPIAALLLIIFFSEMLPKSYAVMRARMLSMVVGPPLVVAVSVLDPIMPILRNVTLVSQRLICPKFEPEPYLEVADIERAIQITTTNKQLAQQEQQILRSIVSLSDLGVEECMRPRRQLKTFRPPVNIEQLREELPRSGYLFITERDNDEITAAVNLSKLSDLRGNHLEHFTESVIFVPWCNTAADAMQKLHAKEREAAVVVNELGETIGVITRKDILDSVFSNRTSRSERLLDREPIRQLNDEVWEAVGMTNVSNLGEYFQVKVPPAKNVTVGGVMQEVLQRLPEVGDQCEWGPFSLEVTQALDDDQILVHVRRLSSEDDE